jgi:peroxiredoxin Q/BCP
MLQPGSPAPEFTLPDQDGHPRVLADLHGRWVLLWWYPKASTPG